MQISKIWAWLAFALFFLTAFCVNAWPVSGSGPMGQLEHTEAIAFGLLFWVLWFAVFGRLWAGVALAAVLALSWWPLELLLRLTAGAAIGPNSVGIALETHGGEMADFLSNYRSIIVPGFLWSTAISLVALILTYRHRLMWTHRSRYWALLIIPSMAFCMWWMFDKQEPTDLKPMKDAFRVEPLGFWAEKWATIYPLDLPLAVRRYMLDSERIALIQRNLNASHMAIRHMNPDGAQIIVLVIGESSRADRWELDGYRRPTNPELTREKNLFFYTNVITRSTATRTAVPALVSRRPVISALGEPGDLAEPSILKPLQNAGYKTFWISNQGSSGFFDTSVALYAREAEVTEFINPTSFDKNGTQDEALLKPLEAALRTKGKLVIVLHTLGSHFSYQHRYPPSFDVYRPSLTDDSAPLDDASIKTRTNNSYDNSILYTDHVLSQVINAVKAKGVSAAVLFASDHGEGIYEPGCITMGVERTSAPAYHVPAFVWLSDQLIAQRPSAVTLLRQKEDMPLISEFMPQTILDLAGVELAYPAPDSLPPSLLSTKVDRRPRMVASVGGGLVDYDEAAARNRCQIAPLKPGR